LTARRGHQSTATIAAPGFAPEHWWAWLPYNPTGDRTEHALVAHPGTAVTRVSVSVPDLKSLAQMWIRLPDDDASATLAPVGSTAP